MNCVQNSPMDNVVSIEDKIAAKKAYEEQVRTEQHFEALMEYLTIDEQMVLMDCYMDSSLPESEFVNKLTYYMSIAQIRKLNENKILM